MNDLIFSTLINGFFIILAVVVTWLLSDRKTNLERKYERAKDVVLEIERLYIDTLSSYHKAIEYTERGSDYTNILNEIAIINAKSVLLLPKELNDRLEEISYLMYKWSSEYRQSLPKKIGESGLSIKSNLDSPHSIKAREIYPELMNKISELVAAFKLDLEFQRKKLK
jgi:hypothetical protein